MGMNVSTTQPSTSGGTAAWQQRGKDMQAMAKALQSGNLDAANAAYKQMTADAPAGKSSNPNSLVSQLGSALQSGNLSAAQAVMTKMQSFHPNRSANPDGGRGTTNVAIPSVSSGVTATVGNNLNVMA
jgi:hypothetical protein